MTRRHPDERSFIAAIRRRFAGWAPPPPAGIGDDAAVLARGRGVLVSVDCLIEGRHFRRDEPPFLLGRKALAVNLSDIAAMGAAPTAFLLTIGLPADLDPAFVDGLISGLADAARRHGVPIVGGDTSGSPGPIVIAVTILGRIPPGGRRSPLTRAGARPGDGIWVSGPLGGSAAGRRLLEDGWRPRINGRGDLTGLTPPRGGHAASGVPPRRRVAAVRLHLDPEPRIDLGRSLRSRRIASAAIDLSDGLSLDLARLAEASGVGARLIGPAIPVHDAARAIAGPLRIDPLAWALDGGEDYELLFTAPPSRDREAARSGSLLVGRITSRQRGLVIAGAGGRSVPLRPGGFDHFVAAPPSSARRRSR